MRKLLLLSCLVLMLSGCGNVECLECRFKNDGNKSEWGANDDEDIRQFPTQRVIIDDSRDD